jgi:hypothetical protein
MGTSAFSGSTVSKNSSVRPTLGQGDIRAQSFRSPGGGNPPIAAEEPCRCRHRSVFTRRALSLWNASVTATLTRSSRGLWLAALAAAEAVCAVTAQVPIALPKTSQFAQIAQQDLV